MRIDSAFHAGFTSRINRSMEEHKDAAMHTTAKFNGQCCSCRFHVTEYRVTEYRVRWKGYDESSDEWKKEQDITSAALDEYKERLKRTISRHVNSQKVSCHLFQRARPFA